MQTATTWIMVTALLLCATGATRPTHAESVIPNIRVSQDRYAAHAEPSLAVNPANPRNLLATAYFTPDAHDMNQGRMPGTFVSFDGGAHWHDNGPLSLPRGYSSGSNIVVAFTSQGAGVLAVRVDSGPDRTGIFAWRTTDGGRHFLPPVALANGSDSSINVDHPWIAAAPPGSSDAGSVFVAWSVTTSRRSDIAFTRSVNDGRHFAPPRLVTGPAPQGDVAPVITAGPEGRVAIVYVDTGASSASAESAASFQRAPIMVVSSTDGGRHFALPREIAPANIGAVSARPMPWFGQAAAATDPRDGTLYVAFPHDRPGTTHPSIALMRSRDGGRTWAALMGGTNGAPAKRMDQLQPQLAVSLDGAVALSYFALNRGRVDLYLALSHDRGETFEPPVRVTGRSWDPTLGLGIGGGQFWIGDYQALAAGPHWIYPAWNDTRTGSLQIFAAAIPA